MSSPVALRSLQDNATVGSRRQKSTRGIKKSSFKNKEDSHRFLSPPFNSRHPIRNNELTEPLLQHQPPSTSPSSSSSSLSSLPSLLSLNSPHPNNRLTHRDIKGFSLLDNSPNSPSHVIDGNASSGFLFDNKRNSNYTYNYNERKSTTRFGPRDTSGNSHDHHPSYQSYRNRHSSSPSPCIASSTSMHGDWSSHPDLTHTTLSPLSNHAVGSRSRSRSISRSEPRLRPRSRSPDSRSRFRSKARSITPPESKADLRSRRGSRDPRNPRSHSPAVSSPPPK
uniref:Uncharacterized protein n=1 Tax=Polytomella parva TaxID=51329 RepID=A0A7S0V713_9CHLO|mmetsp:Transcript_2925/g.4676  ORF Transcript_2925/g.4676 Transcript_2925/m.4676 type:complete len:280 (+) Transcript_2925:610-1449(+)